MALITEYLAEKEAKKNAGHIGQTPCCLGCKHCEFYNYDNAYGLYPCKKHNFYTNLYSTCLDFNPHYD